MANKKTVTPRRLFTPEDDEVIREELSHYPTNLALAFEQAGMKLGRTTGSVSGHYYSVLRTQAGHKPVYAVATRHGVVTNIKQTARSKGEALKLKAYDVATTAVDLLTVEERKSLLRYMMREH